MLLHKIFVLLAMFASVSAFQTFVTPTRSKETSLGASPSVTKRRQALSKIGLVCASLLNAPNMVFAIDDDTAAAMRAM